MAYPWSKKSNDGKEETVAEIKEKNVEKTEVITDQDVPESGEEIVDEEKHGEEIIDSLILNILKLEGYKMDSGELFQAFKEAGGEMENFKGELDSLSEVGKIKSDSDGNIMTVQDYNQEKSRKDEVNTEETVIEIEENNETVEEITEEENDGEDIESIIKLKEETDTWLIEQLKNKENSGNEEELRKEIADLRERVQKLENVIKNMNKAFE
jgi:hypothetical protein|tara:strand:- start:476 stop:1108 length:633 start_codon:yes stop_codon:yes gene_type:complete